MTRSTHLFHVDTDDRLSAAHAADNCRLRMGFVEAADSYPSPDGFTYRWYGSTLAAFVVTHAASGRSHRIPLHAYPGLRKIMAGLFTGSAEGTIEGTMGGGARFVHDDKAWSVTDAATGRTAECSKEGAREAALALNVLLDGQESGPATVAEEPTEPAAEG